MGKGERKGYRNAPLTIGGILDELLYHNLAYNALMIEDFETGIRRLSQRIVRGSGAILWQRRVEIVVIGVVDRKVGRAWPGWPFITTSRICLRRELFLRGRLGLLGIMVDKQVQQRTGAVEAIGGSTPAGGFGG